MNYPSGIVLVVAFFYGMVLAEDKPASPPSELGKRLAAPMIAEDRFLREAQAFLRDRIPPFRVPADTKRWLGEVDAKRKRFLDRVVLRGHPAGIHDEKPAVEWLGRIETDEGYSIRKLRYEGYPGVWIPALLYEPDNLTGKVPVILNPNGHARDQGKADKDKQLRCINFAKRGMIALNPEWIGMGELALPGWSDHNSLAYLDLCGRAGVGVFYMQLKRGLDVLLDHPNADPARVAVTGLSGGGWQTIFLSAIDTRVTLSAPNAGYIGLATRLENSGDIGDLEQNPTDMLTVADYTHLTAWLAPRPALLIFNEKDNCCFPTYRARASVYDPIVPLYERLGLADRFAIHSNLDPGTHNYGLDNRQRFYRFLNAHFVKTGPKRDEEIPSDDELRTKEQLALGVPEGNADFVSLGKKAAANLPRNPLPKGKKLDSLDGWMRARRVALRTCLRIEPATASLVDEKKLESGSYDVRAMRFRVGKDWHVPAVEVVPKGKSCDRIGIVIADGGRAAAEPIVTDLLKENHRVIAVDLLFTGQCVPKGFANWQYAMMMSNVGDRPLGIKVTQLTALIELVRKQYPAAPITLAGVGRVSSVTAVLAAGLIEKGKPDRLLTVGLPASLALLIENKIPYRACPSLFAFGLLAEADINELLVLTLPAKLKMVRSEGDSTRIRTALAGYAALATTASSSTQ